MLIPTSSASKSTGSSPLAQKKNVGLRTETGCLFMDLPLIKELVVLVLSPPDQSISASRRLRPSQKGSSMQLSTGIPGFPSLSCMLQQNVVQQLLKTTSVLAEHLEQLKRRDINLVVVDFNAKIGTGSHHTHSEVVGRFFYHDQTNDNGERLVNLCVEHNLCPAQPRFPHPHGRLWTWSHPAGSKHQLDHILINNKRVNSLRNCRAYNSVELDSDHRIVSIHLLTSLRSNKKTRCKRPKFNWKKLRNSDTKDEFQLELSNRFEGLALDDQSIDLSERYASFESTVRDVAEEVLGKQETHGLPSWVSEETTKLKIQRDEAKKRFQLTKSPQARARLRNLHTRLNESYNVDKTAVQTIGRSAYS